jgi:flavin reductase (DIM6/NTAB) family NADH-FMN oxidoreductase RutF
MAFERGNAVMTALIDPRQLRDAFGAFLTGVTVVTAHSADSGPVGFTANSFASVSLDPPLLLVCLARTSRNFDNFTKATGFAINILAESQKDISNTFARPSEDRFASIGWANGPHGAPVIDNVAAWFDCSTHEVIEAGDHVILIGRVEAFENGTANGLGYARGGYFTAAMAQKAVSAAASDVPVIVSAVAEQDGEVLLVRDAAGKLELPSCALLAGEGPDVLQAHVAAMTRLSASVGYIYSVYEDRGAGSQHIAYRCTLEAGRPATGELFALDALPVAEIARPAIADLLNRYATESVLGNFGVYVGNEQSGKVHPLARKA